jgi:hypothetical protein
VADNDRLFPAEAGIEHERSVVTIPITVAGDQDPVEILKLDALMKLQRNIPFTNAANIRQFTFQILEWELYGRSSALNSNVTFTLSDTVQPVSLCAASGPERDFPATIVYNAIYDAYVGTMRVVQNRPGVAFSHAVTQIPPRGVLIAFEKPFEVHGFSFGAGACGSMTSSGIEFYEREIARARAMRL